MTTFFDHIKESYSLEELEDIASHGCVSGYASTLIYYSDTLKMYDLHCEELHEALAFDIDQFGETPKYITDSLAQGCTSFKNALVWYVAETYANQIVGANEAFND